MITRRRSRPLNNVTSAKVEVVETLETIEDLQLPDTDNVELDHLFEMEDFSWTLGQDAAEPLFNMELDDLNYTEDPSSEYEASRTSFPERAVSNMRTKIRQKQSSQVFNKNAIAARMNRLKKKEYVSNLEMKVGVLSTEVGGLKQENVQLTKRVEELEDETRYLRAVLANESMLAQLLSRLSGVNGMKLSSSLFQGADSHDHDYALPVKRAKVEDKEKSGGICLHVDKNHVSVEFCTKCAENASAALKM